MLQLICEGVPHQFLGVGGTELVVSSNSENVFLLSLQAAISSVKSNILCSRERGPWLQASVVLSAPLQGRHEEVDGAPA